MDGKNDDQDKKGTHHNLADLFQTVLQSAAAYKEAYHYGENHPEAHLEGTGQHISKNGAYLLGSHSRLKGAGQKFKAVGDHPPGYGGVVHHQKITAEDGKITVDMPFAAGLFQDFISLHRTFAACPSYGKLHGEHGKSHDDQKQQVEQDKNSASVLTCHIRKAPDIANANSAASTDQQKTKPGFKRFTTHNRMILSFHN